MATTTDLPRMRLGTYHFSTAAYAFPTDAAYAARRELVRRELRDGNYVVDQLFTALAPQRLILTFSDQEQAHIDMNGEVLWS